MHPPAFDWREQWERLMSAQPLSTAPSDAWVVQVGHLLNMCPPDSPHAATALAASNNWPEALWAHVWLATASPHMNAALPQRILKASKDGVLHKACANHDVWVVLGQELVPLAWKDPDVPAAVEKLLSWPTAPTDPTTMSRLRRLASTVVGPENMFDDDPTKNNVPNAIALGTINALWPCLDIPTRVSVVCGAVADPGLPVSWVLDDNRTEGFTPERWAQMMGSSAASHLNHPDMQILLRHAIDQVAPQATSALKSDVTDHLVGLGDVSLFEYAAVHGVVQADLPHARLAVHNNNTALLTAMLPHVCRPRPPNEYPALARSCMDLLNALGRPPLDHHPPHPHTSVVASILARMPPEVLLAAWGTLAARHPKPSDPDRRPSMFEKDHEWRGDMLFGVMDEPTRAQAVATHPQSLLTESTLVQSWRTKVVLQQAVSTDHVGPSRRM